MRESRQRLSTGLQLAALTTPLAAFTSVMLWLSRYPIHPSAGVEASASNPAGLLTSNCVYDGAINVENIAVSCVFLLILCLYLPRRVGVYLVYLLPVFAVVAAGLAELTAISTRYADLSVCSQACSFYGMSGVAGGMVGFTFAGFFIIFGLTILEATGKLSSAGLESTFGKSDLRGQVVLLSAFLVYIFALLLISGLIALPSPAVPGQTVSGSSGVSPPAILTQTPPVALVHTASLAYGFFFCLATFILANRRYRIIRFRV
jgi:hypothetical protein